MVREADGKKKKKEKKKKEHPHLYHFPPGWGFDWLMRELADWLMN